MKSKVLWLAVWLASMGGLSAQVKVEVILGQNQFLPGETLPVRVRVENLSGQTLHFGKDDWINFSAEGANGMAVTKNGTPPMPHDFDLLSSQIGSHVINLAPYFNFPKTGHYQLRATAHIAGLEQNVVSLSTNLDIMAGVKIWEQEFGVPQKSGPPEVRKYALLQATLSNQTRLYARVMDAAETHTFRVFAIGPMLSFSNPKMRLDQVNNLHLLYQQGARNYNYSVVNPDGDLIVRQTYVYTDSPPRYVVADDGKISIAGGARRVDDTDIPPRTHVTNGVAGQPR